MFIYDFFLVAVSNWGNVTVRFIVCEHDFSALTQLFVLPEPIRDGGNEREREVDINQTHNFGRIYVRMAQMPESCNTTARTLCCKPQHYIVNLDAFLFA